MIKSSKFARENVMVQLREPVALAQDTPKGPQPAFAMGEGSKPIMLMVPIICGVVEESDDENLWVVRYDTQSGQTARLTIQASSVLAVTSISSIRVSNSS